MAIPSNREEFASYCLRKLGDPVIQVNVAVEQVDDRIDEALYKFYERNYQGVEEVFINHDITTPEAILDSNGDNVLDSNGDKTYTTGTDTEAGFIQLPNDIVGVTNVFRPRYAGGIGGGAHNFEFYVDEIYRNILPGAGSGGLSYYYMYQSQLTLLNRYFNPDKQYDYNPITNKLTVAGGLKASDKQYGGLIIRAFRYLHGEAQSTDPSGTVIHNIWKTKWLQDYATALIKQQWAQNLSKYQQVQLLGGVTMNGEQMMAQALDDIQKLEEQLQNEYELPPGFIIG